MFRFEHLEYFWALLLLPAMTVFFVRMRRARRRALLRFGESSLVHRLMPSVSNIKHQLKFGILMLASALLIVAWTNPQWGIKKGEVKSESADIFIAMDVSNSMYAEDVKPSRLERMRTFSVDLIKSLRGERIGTIVFAGNAYIQMPLTADYAAALMFAKSANPEQVPTQGTDLAAAIDLAETAFPKDKSGAAKVIIILSDGEDQDNQALERAKLARSRGIQIFTIGIGTPQGAPMPIRRDDITDYKRDEQGQPILSKLNEPMLTQLASVADGDYYNLATSGGILEALQARVAKLQKRKIAEKAFDIGEKESQYQYFLAAALLLLLAEFALPYRKSAWLEDRDIFK